MTKFCNCCGKELNIDNCSSKIIKGIIKFNGKCKFCRNAKSREVYKNNSSYREKAISRAKNNILLNKDKISEYQKDFYKKNTDYIKQRVKKYSELNRDKVLYNKRIYSQNNKNKLREKQREYRKTDAYKLCHRINQFRRRKYIKDNDDGSISALSIRELLEKQNYLCNITGESLYEGGKLNYHIDHIIPLSKGGKHTIYNIQLVLPSYNILKNNKTKYSLKDFNRDLKKSFYFGKGISPDATIEQK